MMCIHSGIGKVMPNKVSGRYGLYMLQYIFSRLTRSQTYNIRIFARGERSEEGRSLRKRMEETKANKDARGPVRDW